MAERPVHLVGSIPLEDAATVFREAGRRLGDRLARIPDGETGIRRNWISWQHRLFAEQEALVVSEAKEREYQLGPPFRLAPGRGADDMAFGELGYARAAAASWRDFTAAVEEGAVPESCRFQVCLPTPFAPVYSFVAYRDQGAVAPLYEARMLAELAEICRTVPATRLAVQWDVATEMSIFEGLFPLPFLGEAPERALIERIARLGDAVPAEVELGFHLCYGDMNHRHWKEPEDTAVLVRIANAIAASVARPIDWIHIPVPRERDDDAYFAPLAGLALDPGTRLHLGLVHFTDGIAGARRRIAAAERVVSGFGIATECGFGRRDPETVLSLLDLHRAIAGGSGEAGRES
ncbi:MAG: hypothetical protein OXI22_16610 [Defluviicoccus sp.]|nr:hypothetical protein [Defluviicoccus sp.]MDE0385507.1 hypothetical protein [Defluviicoccus sp.]